MTTAIAATPSRDRPTAGALLVAGIVLATLTEAIAGTVLSLGRGDIIGDTYATPDEFAWLDIGYTTLKLIGFMAAPWLMNRINPRSLIIGSTLVMGTTCAIAAITARLDLLVALRIIQGFSGGTLLVGGQAIIFLAYPRHHQPILQALFAMGSVVALRAAGLPLDRLTLHLRTLHPEILGRTAAWAPNEPVEIRDREHGIENSAGFVDSPARRVMETREPLVVRLEGANDPAWIHSDLFEGRGLVEFVAIPLCGSDGPVSAVTFSTTRPGGFAASERVALQRVVPGLRNACELRILRRLERTLLDTYVGATTARRVLAGRVRRGQVETLQTALMLCDLRHRTV